MTLMEESTIMPNLICKIGLPRQLGRTQPAHDPGRNRTSLRRSRTVAVALGLVLTASSLALGQGDGLVAGSGATPPVRTANVWGFKDHQPTEADVRAAESAAGATPPSASATRHVEEEVTKLLQQSDPEAGQAQDEHRSPSGSRD
jgi:hypothetical protein